MKIQIRNMGKEDESFIYSTWLRGLYFGSDFFKKIDKTWFFENYPVVIESLLLESEVKIACLPDDPDVVIGYIVFMDRSLHWCYVKEAFRKQGIGNQLLPTNISIVTHLTKSGEAIRLKKSYKFIPTFWGI